MRSQLSVRPAAQLAARRVDAPGRAAQHRLDDHPAAVRRGRPRSRGRGRTGTTRSARSSATTCRRPWPGRSRRCPPGGAAPGASPARAGRARRRRPATAARPWPPARATSEPATLAARTGGASPPTWSAFTRSPSGHRQRGASGRSALGAARRLGPVLDVPAPLAGDGGQLGLGVDGHGMSDRLQHRKVTGRVGVDDRLRQRQPLGLGVVGHDAGPGPRPWAGRRPARR